MLETTPTTPNPVFDPRRCRDCLASGQPEKRACAAARLLAAGVDLTAITPKATRQ